MNIRLRHLQTRAEDWSSFFLCNASSLNVSLRQKKNAFEEVFLYIYKSNK